MTTIPEDIDAMVALLVENEMIKAIPVACNLCTPTEQCWFCKPMHKHTQRESTANGND